MKWNATKWWGNEWKWEKIGINEKWCQEIDGNEGMNIRERMIGNECNDRKG